jgi:CHAD domain-containing protein
LKKRLNTFGDLRDTQVQLQFMQRVLPEFPQLQPFQEWLRRREQRLIKRLARQVNDFKTGKLSGLMAAVRKQLKVRFAGALEHVDQLPPLLNAADRAYAQVVRLHRQIDPADTATIHRVRVAFKRFRYMIESLQPMLPEVRPRHIKSMHDYQTMMGDLQDVEVLMARVDKLAAKQRIPEAELQPFRKELVRRRGILIRTYLDMADQLFCF